MTDLVSLIKSECDSSLETKIRSTSSWLVDASVRAPTDADHVALTLVTDLLHSLLSCDSVVDGVVRAKLFETAKLLVAHPDQISEASTLKLIDAFPVLMPYLAANVSHYSVSSLSLSIRKHLSTNSTRLIILHLIEMIEAHDSLGSSMKSIAPSFPRLMNLLTLASAIIDGKFVEWLTSGTPAEVTQLQSLICRMTKDASGEVRLFSDLHGIARQASIDGNVSMSKIVRI